MLFGMQLIAADDDRPRPFTASATDPAYLKAITTLRDTAQEAKRLLFPEVPRFSEGPLKSVLYPNLPRVGEIKSFQIPCPEEAPSTKGIYWWIKVFADGNSLYQFDLSPPEKPQPKPFIPKLSKDEALAKCQSFIALLINGEPIHLKENGIQFVQDFNYTHEATPYVGAFWRASFQRISKTGIPVFGDTVSVSLDEQFGLRHFQNACLAQLSLPPDEKPSVPKETATKEAIIFAQRVKNEGPAVKGYFGQHALDKTPVATELMIVRPTDILTCVDMHELKRDGKAVLVWVVTFKLTDANGKLAPGVLHIYIDAVTGKFAGGVC